MMEAFELVALLCAFSAVSVFGDSAEERRKNHLDREWKELKKCQKELNTPESYIDDIYNKQIVPPQSGCYLQCVLTGMGWLTKDGDIHMPAISKDMAIVFSDDEHINLARQKFNECHQSIPGGSSQCDSTSFLIDCIFHKLYHSGEADTTFPHHSEGHEAEN